MGAMLPLATQNCPKSTGTIYPMRCGVVSGLSIVFAQIS